MSFFNLGQENKQVSRVHNSSLQKAEAEGSVQALTTQEDLVSKQLTLQPFLGQQGLFLSPHSCTYASTTGTTTLKGHHLPPSCKWQEVTSVYFKTSLAK